MNLHLENVNLQSTSGPNHFAGKLIKYMQNSGVTFDYSRDADVRLAFIETHTVSPSEAPLFQRLDGIYFNTEQPYHLQNANIQRTYNKANGVIFQSHFNKALTAAYFGEHSNGVVIHNGADVEYIEAAKERPPPHLDKYENIWCCASSWRPHKRLNDNIRYFLEHSSPLDCLVIAGLKNEPVPKHDRIFYVGSISLLQLISLYKRSKYFIHLAWLDHCPNVVVDAHAAGCQIICSSAGGTKEVAGSNATIIEEDEWDFQPVALYQPPPLDFSRHIKNTWEIEYNMNSVAASYYNFLQQSI